MLNSKKSRIFHLLCLSGILVQTVLDAKQVPRRGRSTAAREVYPLVGASTELTAALVDFDNTITVRVTVWDQGKFFADAQPAKQEIGLDVVTPKGINVNSYKDSPPKRDKGDALLVG